MKSLALRVERKQRQVIPQAADILEKLAPEQPVVNDILEYRQLTKLKSTYADGLGAVIEEDGRIHSTLIRRSLPQDASAAQNRTFRIFRFAWSWED